MGRWDMGRWDMLIGEVAKRSGISARMLRHYDRIGLVSPHGRTAGGYREYADADLQRLFHVEGLRSLGLSLAEIADALGDLSFSPVAMVEQLAASTRDRLQREQRLLGRLERVLVSEPEAWSDVLRTIGMLRGLDAGEPTARQRAALALGLEKRQDVASIAEAALNESETNVAGTLDWALARTGDDAIPMLVAALASQQAPRGRRAASALMKIGSPAALAALAQAVAHPDPWVRTQATLVRGRSGHVDAIPALVSLVVDGASDVEAAEALAALADAHGYADEVADELAAAVGREDAAARRRLAGALVEISGERADAALAAMVEDADPQVARAAAALRSQRGRERSRRRRGT